MQRRLRGLQRIALVYTAVTHAQALALEQAASSLREADSLIEQQKMRVRRSDVAGRAALDADDHIDWQMHESQKQFTEWNAEGLRRLRRRSEARIVEAADAYRAGRMQLEQMESVLRDLRSKLDVEHARRAQQESDDRFLAQRWWRERNVADIEEDGSGA